MGAAAPAAAGGFTLGVAFGIAYGIATGVVLGIRDGFKGIAKVPAAMLAGGPSATEKVKFFNTMIAIIETERLILRAWKTEDANPYYQINQDPKVIEFLRGPLTLNQVNDFILAVNMHQEKHGYTLWAAELKETHVLIGFTGLNYTEWESHFTPAVEIGWRLGSQYWGKGYATEGAKACLDYGFR